MSKLTLFTAVFCLFIAILTLLSCTKSPPNQKIPTDSEQIQQSHQEQLLSLQNQLESAQQEAEVSQQTTQETLSELHETKIRSAWITGLCVSIAVMCLITGIAIGVKTKEDALNAVNTKKGAAKTNGKRKTTQSTAENQSK